jgi:hypothetical protein
MHGPRPQCQHGPFAQCTRPTALPGRPRPARHACSTATTSPAHGRRCGERHGGASPARGWWRGASSRYRRRRGEGDGTMAYRRSRRRRRPNGERGRRCDTSGSAMISAKATDVAGRHRWCAHQTHVVGSGKQWSAARVVRRSATRCRNTARRRRGREVAVGTPARGPDSAFKARSTARRGAGTWQPRGNGTLTGGPGVGSGG